MALLGLNERQKELLRKLTGFVVEGKLAEPIVPIPTGSPTRFVVLLRGEPSFSFKHISDLDALCDAGFLDFTWNRMGVGKLYSITEAGLTAVTTNFSHYPRPTTSDMNLSHLLQVMSGGLVESAVLDVDASIIEIANDPVRRLQHVEFLLNGLQEVAQNHLAVTDRVAYDKVLRQFGDELLRPSPNHQRLRQHLHTLSFTGNIPGSLPLIARAWVYLYPLMLLAIAREQVAAKPTGPA